MDSRIPKRIIQVWGGGEHDLSPFAKAGIATIKLLNPDFEYLFFDDNRIDSFTNEHFPEYRSVFNSFRFNIQKYDFFRYLVVYHFGGFYFDLDVFLCENLSDLLENSCVFTFERIGINQYLKRQYNMHWDIGSFAFGAAPGHPFIRAIIENCVRAQRESEWPEIMLKSIPWLFRKDAYVICTTGPGVVTRTYAENPYLQSTVKILMPENMYDRTNWTQFGKYGIDISRYVKQSAWRKKKLNKLQQIIWNRYYLITENRNIRLAQMNK